MKGGLHLHDGEFDDVGTMKMYEQQDLHPAVSVVLMAPGKKDYRCLSLKLAMMGAWLEEPFGSQENLVLPLRPDQEASQLFLEVVRQHCVHDGRLRLVSTAPSGPYLDLLLQDEVLGKLPWDMVFYTGIYNVNTGVPDLKTTLLKKSRDPESCLFNGNWFTAMGGPRMEPYLKDFSTLVAEEDWKVFKKVDAVLHGYQEEFMKKFNQELVAPESLFLEEKTPPEVVTEAGQIWKTGDFPAYRKFCLAAPQKQYVKPKKVNILSSLTRNAPNADWLLGLAIQPTLEHLWKLETGSLIYDPKVSAFQVVVPDDGIPANTFELVLRRPESSMMSSPSAEIQNTMLTFFVTD
jgi:hypothetical protein